MVAESTLVVIALAACDVALPLMAGLATAVVTEMANISVIASVKIVFFIVLSFLVL